MTVARQLSKVNIASIETTLLFLRAADSVLASFDEHFARFGLSDGKFALLMMFLADPFLESDATPSELGRRLGVNRSTITELLDTLQRAALVMRMPHPKDRRKLAIRMTEKGQALMKQFVPIYFRQAESLMGHLNQTEQKQLVLLLTKIYTGVVKAEQPQTQDTVE
jgi:DNA-binding MarR family transcriptional regulator